MDTIDAVRDYWNTRPCNIYHSPAPVGSLDWSREVSSRRYFVESHIISFAEFERWKGKRVLEIGSGIGSDTLEFAKAGAIVRAMDISRESTMLASERLTIEHCHDNTSFLIWNAEEPLPLAWDRFDLVYSWGVLHHTPNPERILMNAHAVMNPGAELRVMLYAKWSIKHLSRQQPEAQPGCPLVRWYSKRAARHLLEQSGFKVISICKDHIFPWKVKDYIKYRYVKAWPYRIMPKRMFHWLERRLGHHMLLICKKD